MPKTICVSINTVFATTITHPWLSQSCTKMLFRTSIKTYILCGLLTSTKPTLFLTPPTENPVPKSEIFFFSVQTRRLQEPFEGSYSSLAYPSEELSRFIASYFSRQRETHAFSDFVGKMGFWGHNFGSRHARRSSKVFIDAGDYLVATKSFRENFCPIGLASRIRQIWSKKRKHTHFASQSQANPSPKSKNVFINRTKKTCCICRGFEQRPSYSGWHVITKKPRANSLARAVVKGCS